MQPQSPATELKIECSFTVEHTGTRALDLPLHLEATDYPFAYAEEVRIALQHFLLPYCDDPTDALNQWACQFIWSDGPTGARELLVEMNQSIRASMLCLARFGDGVQMPYETIRLQSGICRDSATLMIEAVRRLGYASRFLSGYLYTPWLDDSTDGYTGAGATHVWLQVHLPDAGWIPFDPTNNLIGGTDPIRVGVARHASLASPVSGSWDGFPGDFAELFVDGQVRRR